MWREREGRARERERVMGEERGSEEKEDLFYFVHLTLDSFAQFRVSFSSCHVLVVVWDCDTCWSCLFVFIFNLTIYSSNLCTYRYEITLIGKRWIIRTANKKNESKLSKRRTFSPAPRLTNGIC